MLAVCSGVHAKPAGPPPAHNLHAAVLPSASVHWRQMGKADAVPRLLEAVPALSSNITILQLQWQMRASYNKKMCIYGMELLQPAPPQPHRGSAPVGHLRDDGAACMAALAVSCMALLINISSS